MYVYSEKIDNVIRNFLYEMLEFPVPVWAREFLDGYRSYHQHESEDAYSLVLPKNAPQRHIRKIDDNMLRLQLDKIFKAMDDVVKVIKSEYMPIDKTRSEIWRQFPWPADFVDKDYSDLFHHAVKCIMEYEKFQYADNIETEIDIHPELECYYDKDERLIDVTSFNPLREAFVKKDLKLAVIPKYKSDYGLKEKFAQLFKDGIPDKWRVWVAPARIIAEEDVPSKIYIQEERMWGLRFDEAAFKKMFSKEYGKFEYVNNELPDRLMRVPLYKLQYQIASNDKESTASAIIEELIDITYGQSMIDPEAFVYGSSEHYYVRNRMVHLMYDQKQSVFTHLDLSYLYYNESDYYQRLNQTLGQIKPSATKKMKVYKIDGELPFSVISDLIGISLDGVHNPEVRRLLNGE